MKNIIFIWAVLITLLVLIIGVVTVINSVQNLKRDTRQMEYINTNQKAVAQLQEVTIKLSELYGTKIKSK